MSGGSLNHQQQSSALSIARLPLHNLPLVGRTKERNVLLNAYQRLSEHNNKQPPPPANTANNNNKVVMIQGPSGSGKSMLVEDLMLQKQVQTEIQTDQVFCCCGKFNQQQIAVEPYSALKQAFSEVCDSILNLSDPNDREGVCKALRETLGDEANVLADGVVPGILPLLALNSGNNDPASIVSMDASHHSHEHKAQGNADALNRLKHCVHLFIRVVCEHKRLVLFLDDLQWADNATLELLENLLMDMALPQFLMIGAYRNDKEDMPDGHPLRNLLVDVKSLRNIHELELGPLTVADIDGLIRHITNLHKGSDEVQPLSQTVYHKTRGNPFVVVEFLQLLEARRYLFYSLTDFRWDFDLAKIEQETFLADSIVEVVAARIKKSPLAVQRALMVASCLYTRFQLNSLFQILEKLQDQSEEGGHLEFCTSENLRKSLELAVSESLLDKLKDGETYKFSHDRIQQSAYSLLPSKGEERDLFHISLGKIVESLPKARQKQEPANPIYFTWVFIATDQYNRGVGCIQKDPEMRLHVAQLNLRAAKKAISQSAFAPAWNYIQCGINLLDKTNTWETEYTLTLELYTHGAEIASCLGLFEDVELLAKDFLEHVESLDERVPVQMTRIEALASQNKIEEAMDLSRELLKLLGTPFPKKAHMGHVLSAVFRTKNLMKQYTDEDILSMPLMTDSAQALTMKLLQRLSTHACLRQRAPDMLLAMLKLVQTTMKHGLHTITPSALGSYAIVLASLGDHDGAFRLGVLGKKLLNGHLKAKEWEANFIQLFTPFVQHWRETFADCMEQCSKGYLSGMAAGDLEFAFFDATCYCAFYYMSGLRLGPVEKDCRAYGQQMIQYKKYNTFAVTAPLWQLILNLMGNSSNPLIMTGEAMDEETFAAEHVKTNNIAGLQSFWIYKGQVLFYFGRMEEAEQVFLRFAKTSSNIASHFYMVLYAFYYALVVLDLSRKTKKRKYKAASWKLIRTFKRYVSEGNINLSHQLMLLEAEYLALSERRGEVLREAFDKGIRAASRAGFMKDAAIANEQAGICFRDLGSTFWAETYLTRSITLFSEWGAEAKVDHMHRTYPDIFRPAKDESNEYSLEHAEPALSTTSSYGTAIIQDNDGSGRLPRLAHKSFSFRARERFNPDSDKLFRSSEKNSSGDFLPLMELVKE